MFSLVCHDQIYLGFKGCLLNLGHHLIYLIGSNCFKTPSLNCLNTTCRLEVKVMVPSHHSDHQLRMVANKK